MSFIICDGVTVSMLVCCCFVTFVKLEFYGTGTLHTMVYDTLVPGIYMYFIITIISTKMGIVGGGRKVGLGALNIRHAAVGDAVCY